MALTGQDILNSVTKLPLAAEGRVVAGFVIGCSTAANWYFFVSGNPMQTQDRSAGAAAAASRTS